MNSWVLYDTFASLGNDMDHVHASCRSHTMVLLLANGLVLMLPCTVRKLDIHSYGVLVSYMWYTKQLLFSFFPYSGYTKMLSSSYPPSAHLLLDLSFDIGSLPVVRMYVEPMPEFENFDVSMGI